MKRMNVEWFTLIELMVWVAIIAILGTLAFISFTGQIWWSRDSVRLDNLAKIQLYLSAYKEKHWVYPIPTQWFNIVNNWKVVAIQGKLNQEFLLDSFDKVPLDPSIKQPYPYSILKNRSAYQIWATLEDNETLKSVIVWDYSSVAVNVLPSIMLALDPGTWIDVDITPGETEWDLNREKFVLNNSWENFLYTLNWSGVPQVWSLDFDELITSAKADWYWQNIDYKSCEDIKDAGRYIWDGEYQILVGTGLLNRECTIDADS